MMFERDDTVVILHGTYAGELAYVDNVYPGSATRAAYVGVTIIEDSPADGPARMRTTTVDLAPGDVRLVHRGNDEVDGANAALARCGLPLV